VGPDEVAVPIGHHRVTQPAQEKAAAAAPYARLAPCPPSFGAQVAGQDATGFEFLQHIGKPGANVRPD